MGGTGLGKATNRGGKIMANTIGHTPGPWQLHSPTEGNPTTGDGSYSITAVINGDTEVEGVIAHIVPKDWHETPANARLIAAIPELLKAIEVAGRIVGQVQDRQLVTQSERDYALSRASDALGGTYFKATGMPLEWWQCEPSIAKAKGGTRIHTALAERVTDLRQKLGWNQVTLARNSSITQATISRIENGKVTQPKMGQLQKLAETLGTTIDYLASDEDSTLDRCPHFDTIAQARAYISTAIGKLT
jgi:DNA-binding XRE family transcriptional regulator